MRSLDHTGDALGVVQYFVQRDGQGVFMPLHNHPQRIADQNHVDSRGVENAGKGGVIGGDHRQLGAGG